MRASAVASVVAFVGRPGRFTRQQAGAVDRGGRIGEPVRDGLERSDRYAELVALLRVLDAELERGARQADQRAGGEHPPFVDRVFVELAGSGAVRHDRARTVSERAVGNRAVAEVVHRHRAAPRSVSTDHELAVVEPDHDGRDRPRRYETCQPFARRLQRERSRRAGARRSTRSKTGRAGAPPAASRRAATSPSTSGMGARTAPNRSATSSRSSSVAPPPPTAGSAPIVGPPSPPNASQSSASNPSVSSDARTTAGGHSLRKKVPNASTSCSCSSLSERSTAYGALGVGALGVNVAGMRCHPPTIAQSG